MTLNAFLASRKPETAQKVLALLTSLSQNFVLGKHYLPENIYAIAEVYNTKDENDLDFENRNLTDEYHFVLEGKEVIELAPANKLENKVPYNFAKDVSIYRKSPLGTEAEKVVLTPQTGCFIPTGMGRKAGLNVDGVSFVKKVIFMIPSE